MCFYVCVCIYIYIYTHTQICKHVCICMCLRRHTILIKNVIQTHTHRLRLPKEVSGSISMCLCRHTILKKNVIQTHTHRLRLPKEVSGSVSPIKDISISATSFSRNSTMLLQSSSGAPLSALSNDCNYVTTDDLHDSFDKSVRKMKGKAVVV
jgi:hypothetical protein